MMVRGFRMDPSVTKQKLKPGTVRRIATYARPYRVLLAVFLLATAVDAVITVVNPLLLREIIDRGNPGPQRPGRHPDRGSGRGGRDLRRRARLRDPLVLRPDRRGPDL